MFLLDDIVAVRAHARKRNWEGLRSEKHPDCTITQLAPSKNLLVRPVPIPDLPRRRRRMDPQLHDLRESFFLYPLLVDGSLGVACTAHSVHMHLEDT